MTTTVRKWGNSASVRIPGPIMRAAGLVVDAEVDVRAERERIVIEPVRRRRYELADLLKQIRPQNLHKAVDFGPPRGKEVW
ncbi:MAG: AbrB/MazE/SpoVT family DNA-binding domain-containing protein [Terriglobales bacterium]